VVAIPTRYGDITVTRDDPECCIGRFEFGDQRVEIASTGQIYASLEGIFKVKEGTWWSLALHQAQEDRPRGTIMYY